MVVADVIRAVAFVGIALVDGFVPTVALALLAGIGHRRCSRPASLAALPSLVEPAAAARRHLAVRGDHRLRPGRRARPLAALLLLARGPETILVAERTARPSPSRAARCCAGRASAARRPRPRDTPRSASLFATPARASAPCAHAPGLRDRAVRLGRGAVLRRPLQRRRAAVRDRGPGRRRRGLLGGSWPCCGTGLRRRVAGGRRRRRARRSRAATCSACSSWAPASC